MCVCVCACVCARVRVCVCVCAEACQKLVSAVGSKAGAGDIAAAEAIGSMHSKRFVEEICSPNRYFYPQLIQISNPQNLVQLILILFQVCTVPDIILCVCVV